MNFKYKKGFTLIETLVAITVLMIAIAGPLTIANKAFTSSIDARNQLIAMNLAQQALERINYFKDNQIDMFAGWSPRSNVKPQIFDDCYSIDKTCDSINGITNAGGIFTRYYYFSYDPVNKDQVIANVQVSWKTGEISSSILFQTMLTNYSR